MVVGALTCFRHALQGPWRVVDGHWASSQLSLIRRRDWARYDEGVLFFSFRRGRGVGAHGVSLDRGDGRRPSMPAGAEWNGWMISAARRGACSSAG